MNLYIYIMSAFIELMVFFRCVFPTSFNFFLFFFVFLFFFPPVLQYLLIYFAEILEW